MREIYLFLGMSWLTILPLVLSAQCIATNGSTDGNQINVTVTPTAFSINGNFDGSNCYLSGSVTYTLSNLILGQWTPTADMEFHLVVNGTAIESTIHIQAINSGTALTSYTFSFSNLYFGPVCPTNATYGVRMGMWGIWSAPCILASTLPVTLTKFEHWNGNLIWETASESNNEGFRILHSIDAKTWNQEGFVPGIQNRSLAHSYVYNIQKPGDYYRLEQVDYDGATWLSEIVSTSSNTANQSIFPNPSTGVIYMQGNSINQPYTLFNSAGQLMKSGYFEVNIINLGDVNDGLYFLKVGETMNKVILNKG